MRWLLLLLRAGLFLSALGFLGSFLVESSYAGKAQLVQRVQVIPAEENIFGDPPTPIGSPQLMIIEDKGAFVEGEGPDGAKLVSEGYLTENKIYPLQLQTVRFFAENARLGSGIAFAVCLLGAILLGRKISKPSPPLNA
jgi:hypothetical protein